MMASWRGRAAWGARVLGVLCCLGVLAACGPREPLRIGFLGGLSGPVADLGEAGRDGALLAVEEANATGGIGGRRIELLVTDDAQRDAQAERAVEMLAGQGVEAVIGPMTSAMGLAALPVAKRLGVLLVSPTILASPFVERDDNLFMVSASVGTATRLCAAFLYARGQRRIALAYDVRNQAFTADWAEHFRSEFAALGGVVVAQTPFSSGDLPSYEAAARRLAAAQPDALHFVTSAVDAVRLTQATRHLGMQVPISTASWAATEHLVQLGGRSVEGLVVTQLFNRNDASPTYRAFHQAFVGRFGQEPGFAAVLAYDATRALLAAYAKRRSGQALKDALLAAGPFDGVQQRWTFDRYGDARREVFIAEVRDGRFERVEAP